MSEFIEMNNEELAELALSGRLEIKIRNLGLSTEGAVLRTIHSEAVVLEDTIEQRDKELAELESRLKKSREVCDQLQNVVLGVYQDLSNAESIDGDRFAQLKHASYEYEKHHDFINAVGKHTKPVDGGEG